MATTEQRRRRVDVVTIVFERRRRVRRIVEVCIIGRVGRCRPLLRPSLRLVPAIRCLLREGFVLIRLRGNVLVFRRIR